MNIRNFIQIWQRNRKFVNQKATMYDCVTMNDQLFVENYQLAETW